MSQRNQEEIFLSSCTDHPPPSLPKTELSIMDDVLPAAATYSWGELGREGQSKTEKQVKKRHCCTRSRLRLLFKQQWKSTMSKVVNVR